MACICFELIPVLLGFFTKALLGASGSLPAPWEFPKGDEGCFRPRVLQVDTAG
jgi:hypothetical protein